MSNAESRTAAFTAARDLLLQLRSDHDEAQERFSWPQPAEFNWALDWFDALGTRPDRRDQVALRIVEEDGSEQQWTFSQLAARTDQVANWLRAQGVGRGDRMIVMLGNQIELWEMVLAIMKLGAVLIPATTLLGPADLRDRVDRGRARRRGRHLGRHRQVRRGPRRLHPDLRRRARGRLVELHRQRRCGRRVQPRRGDPCDRHAAALLHLGDDLPAEAGGAHPRVLSHRALVDHVLDRRAARRRPPQHLLAGLGQARVEQRLRPVERRSHGAHLQLPAVRPRRAPGAGPAVRGDDLLCAAHGVAHAHPGRPRQPGRAARGCRRGRATQPGDNRAGTRRGGG